MDKLKLFLEVHIRYWVLYGLSLVLLLISIVFSLYLDAYLTYGGYSVEETRLICSLFMGVFSSIPLLIPNTVYSKEVNTRFGSNRIIVIVVTQTLLSLLYFIISLMLYK